MHCVKSKLNFQISFPWDLLTADKELRGNIINKKLNNNSIIGNNNKIIGKIINSSIGNNCIIDGNVKNSIVMDNVTIDKDSIVEDSIIGENVHFNGKIISKNNVYSIVNNKKINVESLGAIIGDNVKANNVTINAGCKIWPNKNIKGEINNDIK